MRGHDQVIHFKTIHTGWCCLVWNEHHGCRGLLWIREEKWPMARGDRRRGSHRITGQQSSRIGHRMCLKELSSTWWQWQFKLDPFIPLTGKSIAIVRDTDEKRRDSYRFEGIQMASCSRFNVSVFAWAKWITNGRISCSRDTKLMRSEEIRTRSNRLRSHEARFSKPSSTSPGTNRPCWPSGARTKSPVCILCIIASPWWMISNRYVAWKSDSLNPPAVRGPNSTVNWLTLIWTNGLNQTRNRRRLSTYLIEDLSSIIVSIFVFAR